MGKKAKLKKIRKCLLKSNKSNKSEPQYDSTQFVEQFEKMGYQIHGNKRGKGETNIANLSPEIPQDRIEPQL